MVGCLLFAMGGAALLLAGSGARAGSNMRDQLIQHYCLKAVNAELAASGKPAPAGMPEFTCSCVVQQVDARASIPQAQAICRSQAIQQFNLAP